MHVGGQRLTRKRLAYAAADNERHARARGRQRLDDEARRLDVRRIQAADEHRCRPGRQLAVALERGPPGGNLAVRPGAVNVPFGTTCILANGMS